MKSIYSFSIIIFILLIAATACNKKGDPGPIGPVQTDMSSGLVVDGGYIKGTIATKLSNGTDVYIDFNYQMNATPATYASNLLTGVYYKNYMDGYEKETDMSSITLYTSDLTIVPLTFSMNFHGTAPVSSDSIFVFDVENVTQSNVVMSNWSYDHVTRTASGNFSTTAAFPSGNNGRPTTVSGSFKFPNVRQYTY